MTMQPNHNRFGFNSSNQHRLFQGVLLASLGFPLIFTACTGYDVLFGPYRNDPPSGDTQLAVAIAQPRSTEIATAGVTTVIQWSDLTPSIGTSVRVSAQQQDNVGGNIGSAIQLIGNGTPGSGRDAVADGNNDVYEWDLTGIRVGDYVIAVTLDAPDGTTATVVSRDPTQGTTGIIRVITSLPVPTLTFTAPGNSDVTVNVGNTYNITWTDNGTANAEALLTLGLDTDAIHDNGNEIILLRDQPLSTNDNTGTFTFNFLDENGASVPNDTYTVFARLDDGANQIVTKTATGKLILAP